MSMNECFQGFSGLAWDYPRYHSVVPQQLTETHLSLPVWYSVAGVVDVMVSSSSKLSDYQALSATLLQSQLYRVRAISHKSHTSTPDKLPACEWVLLESIDAQQKQLKLWCCGWILNANEWTTWQKCILDVPPWLFGLRFLYALGSSLWCSKARQWQYLIIRYFISIYCQVK